MLKNAKKKWHVSLFHHNLKKMQILSFWMRKSLFFEDYGPQNIFLYYFGIILVCIPNLSQKFGNFAYF